MTVLADVDITRYGSRGMIDPFNLEQVQPSSYDVRLSPSFLVPRSSNVELDTLDKDSVADLFTKIYVEPEDAYVLGPQKFVLGCTDEVVNIPHDMVCRIEGKSSIGRMGIVIHATAGYVDPGFHGAITLEIFNMLHCPVRIYPGTLFAQLSFSMMTQSALRPYGHPDLKSRYQGNRSVTASRYDGC